MNRYLVHDAAKIYDCASGTVHDINRVVNIAEVSMEQDDEPEAGDGETNAVGGANTRVPPYVAYSTLLTLFKELKDNGLPPQLDKSVLKRFAFGIQGQLKMAQMKRLYREGGPRSQKQVQANVGLWVRASGVVRTPSFIGNAMSAVLIHDGEDSSPALTVLGFEPDEDRALDLADGDRITIEGEILSIDSLSLSLYHCRLL